MLEYHQKLAKSCCLSCLESDFHSIGDNRDVTKLWNCIEELLKLQTDKFRNRTNFAYDIMTNKTNIKGEQHLIYNTKM